jgi:NAD(P)-dependent dehydrogenase (short-subunit alcohol dehydrogenase family)
VSVCVVTGGSRGIGAAIAAEAAGLGVDVLITYVSNADAAAATVAALTARGVRAAAARADLGEPGDVPGIFTAADALGPLGALVNNAGVIDDSAPARPSPPSASGGFST